MTKLSVVPDPPLAGDLDPLEFVWPAGQRMWRVHQAAYAPDGFNPDPVSAGRFRPFPSSRKVVPTMYIADSFDAAISESVFHDLDPHASDQIVPRARLYGQVRSIITPSRDLRLADLRGAGLRRIRLKTTDLIETDPDSYPDTARWGRAIYGCPLKPGGIAWSSRMHPAGTAAILFGTRAKGLAFDYDDIKPLWQGEAFDEFLAAAERAKVTVLL